MKYELAKNAGYCYGVERALRLAQQAAKTSPKPIMTLGPIIHNPQVVDELKKLGINPVSDIDGLNSGTIVIRTHGVGSKVIGIAKKHGLSVIDATCPFVKKAQRCAAKLIKEGYQVLIVGERNHPEVIGIMAYANGKGTVIENPSELKNIKLLKRVGIVVQTTQSSENLGNVIKKVLPEISEIKIFNTICDATTKRQATAAELAGKVDAMLVVGGKNSANTTRLAQICSNYNKNTYHIETAKEINPEWFSGDMLIGITAGASTADWILKEVIDYVSAL
jgi:(E)-4-hydroxy-3-methyl-but-2-enyl pyrophosphate reductase